MLTRRVDDVTGSMGQMMEMGKIGKMVEMGKWVK